MYNVLKTVEKKKKYTFIGGISVSGKPYKDGNSAVSWSIFGQSVINNRLYYLFCLPIEMCWGALESYESWHLYSILRLREAQK